MIVLGNTIGLLRERIVRGQTIHERTTVRNYGPTSATVRLALAFRASFEDVFIVKGFVGGPRGRLRAPVVRGGDCVVLRYDGRDGYARETRLTFAPRPARLSRRNATLRRHAGAGRRAGHRGRHHPVRDACGRHPAALAVPADAGRRARALAGAGGSSVAGRHHPGARVEPAVRAGVRPGAPRSPPAPLEPGRLRLLRGRRALVRDAFRPRLRHRGHPDAAVRLGRRPRHAAPARALPGARGRCLPRRRARQDPARVPHG